MRVSIDRRGGRGVPEVRGTRRRGPQRVSATRSSVDALSDGRVAVGGTMASKDKGGAKDKKTASKTLKEKREAKKAKAAQQQRGGQ